MIPSSTARDTMESPATGCYSVTPTDDVEVGSIQPRGLYVGVGGNISMMLEGDTSAVTFVDVPSGVLLPLKVRIVMATGTTATDLVAIY